jgi:hypothetical protein
MMFHQTLAIQAIQRNGMAGGIDPAYDLLDKPWAARQAMKMVINSMSVPERNTI